MELCAPKYLDRQEENAQIKNYSSLGVKGLFL
jgi:hypothetical protein